MRFVRTALLSSDVQDHVQGQGVRFAEASDAELLVLKIAATPSINGLSHTLSNIVVLFSIETLLGRSFAVVPRNEEAPLGYIDQDIDDYDASSRPGRFENLMLSKSQLTKAKPTYQ